MSTGSAPAIAEQFLWVNEMYRVNAFLSCDPVIVMSGGLWLDYIHGDINHRASDHAEP
jgi:hypothetical protein